MKRKSSKKCCPLLDTTVSGSPIIQNGMLVGAVTHVFVNNALQGYGIFAETMLKESQSVETAELEQEERAQVA